MNKSIPSPPRARAAPSEGRSTAWIALGALIAGLPWAYYRGWPTRDPMSDLKWPIAAAGLAIAMACLIPWRSGKTGPHSSTSNQNLRLVFIGAGLIALGLTISIFFSPAQSLGVRTGLRELMFVAACCALSNARISNLTFNRILALYLISASVQAALTIWQWKFGIGNAQPPGRLAMIGTLGNPEYVAGWLAPAASIALVWLMQPALSGLMRTVLASSAALVGGSIILSGGRGAAIAVVAGVLGFWATKRASSTPEELSVDRKGMLGKSALLAVGGILFGILIFSAILSSEVRRQSLVGRLGEMFDPHSISVRHRLGLMIVTSNMIAEHPIVGSGPGRFAAAFDRTRGRMAREAPSMGVWAFNDIQGDQPAAEAHCDWLQWWAEYGLLPFLGLLLMTGATLATLTEKGVEPENPARWLLLAGLVALLVHMLFGFPLHRADRALLFWSLLAMSHAIRR